MIPTQQSICMHIIGCCKWLRHQCILHIEISITVKQLWEWWWWRCHCGSCRTICCGWGSWQCVALDSHPVDVPTVVLHANGAQHNTWNCMNFSHICSPLSYSRLIFESWVFVVMTLSLLDGKLDGNAIIVETTIWFFMPYTLKQPLHKMKMILKSHQWLFNLSSLK